MAVAIYMWWYHNKHWTQKRHTVQMSDCTKVRLVKMSNCYKWRTGANLGLVQTSDWYQRRTGANVGLVQRSEWYKPWTRTDIRLVQTSDWYKCIFIELSSVCNYLSLNWKCFNYGFMYSKQARNISSIWLSNDL